MQRSQVAIVKNPVDPRRDAGERRELGLPDAEAYWRAPLERATCRSLLEKYEALAELEALAPGPAQDRLLRAAARTWPGCLRESQLAGPARCRARRDALQRALSSAARDSDVDGEPRSSWRERGHASVPLWADLHGLLGDQQRWRAHLVDAREIARARAPDASLAFLDFARREGGRDASARWPATAALLNAAAGPVVRPRQAYLWLATRAGLALAELNAELFGRSGHWDQRPDDPPVR